MKQSLTTLKRKRASFGRRRGTFEILEPRLALAVDLAYAGVFETLSSSTTSSFVSNSNYDFTNGGGLVADDAGNRYVTLIGRTSHSVDLDPGSGVDATTMNAALLKLSPSGDVLWKAVYNPTTAAPPVMRIFHAVDADQNVYMVGDFRGIVDFDPGPGVVSVSSTVGGTEYAYYLSKLNSDGQLLWVRYLDAPNLTPQGMGIDAAGNLVIANSSFASPTDPPIDVDAGPGQVLLQDQGSDIVLLKYTTDGDFAWVRQFVSSGGSVATPRIAVNDNGDSYVISGFTGSVDLDPGVGTFVVTNQDTSSDGFVARFDAAGNFGSAYTAAGTAEGSNPTFKAIHLAGDGSIVVSGHFRGTVDFDPGAGALTLTSSGSTSSVSGFALKLDSDMSVLWARKFGKLVGEGETAVTELETDQDGNVYIGGSFGRLTSPGATYDFDPGPNIYEVVAPSTHETAYLLSLNGAGDFRWVAPLGGNSGRAQVQGITTDNDSNVHVAGAFRGTGDFDPDPAEEYPLNNGALQSVFVATLAQNNPDPGAPVVDAGTGQSIVITGSANLDGTVIDDGLPNPLTTTWSLASGPGTATFGNASDVDTTATFSAVGTYLLKLEATDGMFTTADYVQVTVNPLSVALTTIADTYIDGGSKTTNFGGSTNLIVDGQPDDATILKWDLSSIPAGSTLQSASLSINVTSTSSNSYEIYEVKRSWTESQATWKKANSSTNWQSAGAQGALDAGSTVLGTITATTTGLKTITLNAAGLAVVQGWINNPATNYGFIIRDYANSNKDDLVFSSREVAVAANRPQLNIAYSPPIAVPLSAPQGGAASSSDGSGTLAAKLEQSSSPTKKAAGRSLTAASSVSAAGSAESASLLLATKSAAPSRSETVDLVITDFSENESTWMSDSLDDELLAALVAV
jgi:hypothetical protein